MNKIENRIISFIKKNGLIKKGERVLVGLSGGPDSVFLLHILNKFKKMFGVEISAVHINHCLRGEESDGDEEFCKNFCRELKIQIYVKRVAVLEIVKEERVSIEEGARIARYRIFEEVMIQSGYDKIATGHNRDDNLETVLLNFIKRGGLLGFSGIPIMRGKIIRPIICVERNEIIDYLKRSGREYCIDNTNSDDKYERNNIRINIIPLIKEINPSISNQVLNQSQLFREIREFVDTNIISIAQKNNVILANNELLIKNEIFNNSMVGLFIKGEIIKMLTAANLGIRLDYERISAVVGLFDKQPGTLIDINEKYICERVRSGIVFRGREVISEQEYIVDLFTSIETESFIFSSRLADKDEVELGKEKEREYISLDALSGRSIKIRKWREGDYFYPIGMKGRKKISDFLINLKIENTKKTNIYVMTDEEKIVWVIGYRLDSRYKIKDINQKVLEIRIRKKNG